ncbi:MAG: hypothetical protein ACRYFZ_27890 [Janthinobacterium lividum]
MVREPKDVDFYTTGRQPSEQEFTRISEWIKQDKQKQAARKPQAATATEKLAK